MKLQHHQIITEAQKRGYTVTDLSEVLGTMAANITKGAKTELFVEGTPLSLINLRALKYFDHKQLTKIALAELGIPHPQSILFNDPKETSLKAFFKPGQTYVCKPPDMTEGIGVEMNITSLEAIEDYWNRHQDLGPSFMLEEQIKGEDLRVQVIGGQIVAACTREPAFVVGDGENDLNTLIEQRRIIVRGQNPSNDLVIDKATLELLEQQSIRLDDVPDKGQKVRLKELANMSQGAVAIDLTDTLHPILQEWTSKIVNHLGVDYFAIDFMAEDFSAAQAVVLEINAKPEWLHHTFSERKQHDLAGLVLDDLFG